VRLARFKQGLSAINLWYSAAHTFTLILDGALPAGALENAAPYARRGWCIFEQRLSSLIKSSNCFLRLGALADAEDGPAPDWFGVIKTCATRRQPPMPPDLFEDMMRDGVAREAAAPGTGIRFTSGKDLGEVVIPQYRRRALLHLETRRGWLRTAGIFP
jgi:hypothetical protein